MEDTKDRPFAPRELTSPQPDSTDPAYQAWKKRKIQAAIKHADEYPDDGVTEEEIWQKFGLDH